MVTAIFGAGCFWGVEAAFRQVEGVTATDVGYSGGSVADPDYKLVCTGTSGHAEVVRVEYDAERVTYEQLLDVFWACHDPTQVNRQGPDFGTQYRTAILFMDAEQETAARLSKEAVASRFAAPIATEITPAGEYYPAEEYHQQYLEKRGQTSCSTSIASKPTSTSRD